ncbi:processed acidic surface protein [Planococcus sp. CP5-4]|uniref:processed acidic surface protein n=1 Tax=unclassified Planococcus (in: firmicutes) TaxID=2662419 RepID=UPI001C24D8FA|nr:MULTISPECIES: processed acidic surface protein [unclassified Planococcus (in: firmicutes)]MBU9673700.1 processed acidic surface protein [Planococcus sp. CP5-4_YE]MBV0907990.1 processed acidic surface protein [Planococcus sp. CP5-4_UN]MBW6063157.1 processed acidic surface protein [Planococcus sp. CP5-4]
MKGALTLITSLLLAIAIGAVPAFAISDDDRGFNRLLTEIGWEKADYIDYLDSKGWTLDDFYSSTDLGTPLTEDSISQVMSAYELTRAELNSLLEEFGDLDAGVDVLDGDFIIFTEELEDSIDFYLNFEEELTPITEANLALLLEDFGFTSKDELEEFLNLFDDSLADYEFIEDLESSIMFYQEEWLFDLDMEEVFAEFGVTEQELERLAKHFETLDYMNPEFEERLMALSERMMAIEDFSTVTELSAEQIAELLSIYDEFMEIFEMEAKYYFVKGDEKKEMSVQSLISLESTDGYDLLIELYDLEGDFLADILLTADMFGSDLIVDTGKELENSTPTVIPPSKQPADNTNQTVKGGKLPKTASDFAQNTVIGLGFIAFGALLFRRARVKPTS